MGLTLHTLFEARGIGVAVDVVYLLPREVKARALRQTSYLLPIEHVHVDLKSRVWVWVRLSGATRVAPETCISRDMQRHASATQPYSSAHAFEPLPLPCSLTSLQKM